MRRAVWKWTLIGGCWLIFGLFNASRLRLEIPDASWGQTLTYAMPDALFWALLTPVVQALAGRFPVRPENALTRVPLHLVLGLLTAFTHITVDTAWNQTRVAAPAFAELFAKLTRHTLHLNLVVYGVIVALVHFFDHYSKTRDAERRAAELRAQLSDARLAALEAQLRPHFLFNTLHAISGLMETDPRAGRQVVCRLAELLRRSLRDGERREVALERELENVRAYLEIEQARFDGRLAARVHADPAALGCAVPGFILQPIVENAVHHGLADGTGEIEVSVSRRDGHVDLCVRDSGTGNGGPGGHGVGLSNTAARLAEMYGDEAALRIEPREGGGTAVTLTLPAREQR
jgi:signal transduction histidine kinase